MRVQLGHAAAVAPDVGVAPGIKRKKDGMMQPAQDPPCGSMEVRILMVFFNFMESHNVM